MSYPNIGYAPAYGYQNPSLIGAFPGYGAGYAGSAYPMVGPMSWDIVGAEEKGIVDKTKTFLNEETAGVKNGYLLGGATALGLIWYGYSKNWFGGRR